MAAGGCAKTTASVTASVASIVPESRTAKGWGREGVRFGGHGVGQPGGPHPGCLRRSRATRQRHVKIQRGSAKLPCPRIDQPFSPTIPATHAKKREVKTIRCEKLISRQTTPSSANRASPHSPGRKLEAISCHLSGREEVWGRAGRAGRARRGAKGCAREPKGADLIPASRKPTGISKMSRTGTDRLG